MTAFFPRPIRTVRMPLAELGRHAARLLIRRIENPALAPVHEKLEPEQIETEPIGFFNK
jgi:DNA-binding LacI/PurR family transcriptional regulator